MKVYVFDTSSFRVMDHYFHDRFPSFWRDFESSLRDGEILSTREVYNEIMDQGIRLHLADWIKSNRSIFPIPADSETSFLPQIFSIKPFQQLVNEKARLKGKPVADPFVIAAAKAKDDGCVVTEEKPKPNSPNIPSVCRHFDIACCNLEAFMNSKGWAY